MIASFLITLREGIEAALVVAIVLAYLNKVGAKSLYRPVYIGILSGILGSVAVGSLFILVSFEFEGTGEQIFEGATMLIAAIVLTTMILWMRDNSRSYSEGLKEKVQQALSQRETFGLTALVFVSILREGIEAVLFLGSASFTSKGIQTVLGGTLGLALAVVLGLAIIKYSVKLNMRTFFNITGIFLVLFAAGLVARSLGEFQEAGLVPAGVEHLWSTSAILSDQGALGETLSVLFGYIASPSLTQVLGYVAYWVLVVVWIFRKETASFLRRISASVRPSV